jgi:hypothetical protein
MDVNSPGDNGFDHGNKDTWDWTIQLRKPSKYLRSLVKKSVLGTQNKLVQTTWLCYASFYAVQTEKALKVTWNVGRSSPTTPWKKSPKHFGRL